MNPLINFLFRKNTSCSSVKLIRKLSYAFYLKAVTAFTLVTLLILPHMSWAFDMANYAAVGNKPLDTSLLNEMIVDPNQLSFIKRSTQQHPKMVICIEDLHCHYEVQKNISKFIHYLTEKYNLKLVGEEGAFDTLDLSPLTSIPVPEVKESVSDYFMRQGKISGVEYYAAVGDNPVILEGIETPALYLESYQLLKSFLNAESQGLVYDLRDMLEEAKKSLYTRALQDVDKKTMNYRNGKMDLHAYAAFLGKMAGKFRIDSRRFPVLFKFLHDEHHFYNNQKDPEHLFEELEQLKALVHENLYTKTDQRELDGLYQRLDTIEKVLSVSGTPNELNHFFKYRDQYQITRFITFMENHHFLDTALMDIDDLYQLDNYLDRVARFYQLADERSATFAENIIRKMGIEEQQLAVMVIGGFHTQKVLSTLRQHGVQAVAVKPKLTRLDYANPYFSLLQERPDRLEELLASHQNKFAIRSTLQDVQTPTRQQQVFKNLVELRAKTAILAQSWRKRMSPQKMIDKMNSVWVQYFQAGKISIDREQFVEANREQELQTQALVIPMQVEMQQGPMSLVAVASEQSAATNLSASQTLGPGIAIGDLHYDIMKAGESIQATVKNIKSSARALKTSKVSLIKRVFKSKVVKLIVGIVLFTVTSAFAGDSGSFASIRQSSPWTWLVMIFGLALLVKIMKWFSLQRMDEKLAKFPAVIKANFKSLSAGGYNYEVQKEFTTSLVAADLLKQVKKKSKLYQTEVMQANNPALAAHVDQELLKQAQLWAKMLFGSNTRDHYWTIKSQMRSFTTSGLKKIVAQAKETVESHSQGERETAAVFQTLVNQEPVDLVVMGSMSDGEKLGDGDEQVLAESFVDSLKQVWPGMRVKLVYPEAVMESSLKGDHGKVILTDKHTAEETLIGPQTTFFVISQRGIHDEARQLIDKLENRFESHVFVQTDRRQNVFSNQQNNRPPPKGYKRVFATDPHSENQDNNLANVIVDRWFLNDLTLMIAESGLKAFKHRQDTPIAWKESDFKELRKARQQLLEDEMPSVVGKDTEGNKVEQRDHRENSAVQSLIQNWISDNVISNILWYLVFLPFVTIYGANLISGGSLLLSEYFMFPTILAEGSLKIVLAVTILFFVLMSTYFRRFFQGREVMQRLGIPTVVIMGDKYNKRLMAKYLIDSFRGSRGGTDINIQAETPTEILHHKGIFGRWVLLMTLLSSHDYGNALMCLRQLVFGNLSIGGRGTKGVIAGSKDVKIDEISQMKIPQVPVAKEIKPLYENYHSVFNLMASYKLWRGVIRKITGEGQPWYLRWLSPKAYSFFNPTQDKRKIKQQSKKKTKPFVYYGVGFFLGFSILGIPLKAGALSAVVAMLIMKKFGNRIDGKSTLGCGLGCFGTGATRGDSEGETDPTVESIRKVTQGRGSQAEGVSMFYQTPQGGWKCADVKVVATKRQILAKEMTAAVAKKRDQLLASQEMNPNTPVIFMDHSRWATFGKTSLDATQPLKWSKDIEVTVEKQSLSSQSDKANKVTSWIKEVILSGIRIAANGDFDYIRIGKNKLDNGQAGKLLGKVLHDENWVGSDSLKIAGMMEWFVSKGIWKRAIRFSYYFGMLDADIKDVLFTEEDHRILKPEEEDLLGRMFESVFEEDRNIGKDALKQKMETMIKKMEIGNEGQKFNQEDLDVFKAMQNRGCWDSKGRDRFIAMTVDAFFEQDVLASVKRFLSMAEESSFGLHVVSLLDPMVQVIASRQLSVNVGMNRETGQFGIFSESSAALMGEKSDELGIQELLMLKKGPGSEGGEVIELRVLPDGRKEKLALRGYSFADKKELTHAALIERAIGLKDNPWPERPQVDITPGQEVEQVAQTLGRVERVWSDVALEDPKEELRRTINEKAMARLLPMLLGRLLERFIKKGAAYQAVPASVEEFSYTMFESLSNQLAEKAAGSSDKIREQLANNYFSERLVDGVEQSVKTFIHDAIDAQLCHLADLKAQEFLKASDKTKVFADWRGVTEDEINQLVEKAYQDLDRMLVKVNQDILAEFEGRQIDEDAIASIINQIVSRFHDLSPPRKEVLNDDQTVDLYIAGQENNEYLGNEVLKHLRRHLPGFLGSVKSCNAVLDDMPNVAFGPRSVVLAVSQSTETYPVVALTEALNNIMPERLFLMTGKVFSPLGQALGQNYGVDSPPVGKLIYTGAPVTTSEVSGLTIAATEATFSIMWKKIVDAFTGVEEHVNAVDQQPESYMLDAVHHRVAKITGVDGSLEKRMDKLNQDLTEKSIQWGKNRKEVPKAKLAVIIHVVLAVVGGVWMGDYIIALFPETTARLVGYLPEIVMGIAAPTELVGRVVQYFVFALFTVIVITLLRLIQGRPLLARLLTNRRLHVMANNVDYVLEIYGAKLNGMAYASNGISTHAAEEPQKWRRWLLPRVRRGDLVLAVEDATDPDQKVTQGVKKLLEHFSKHPLSVLGAKPDIILIGAKENVAGTKQFDVPGELKGEKKKVHQGEGSSTVESYYEKLLSNVQRLILGMTILTKMEEEVAGDNGPFWYQKIFGFQIGRTQGTAGVQSTKNPVGLNEGKLDRFRDRFRNGKKKQPVKESKDQSSASAADDQPTMETSQAKQAQAQGDQEPEKRNVTEMFKHMMRKKTTAGTDKKTGGPLVMRLQLSNERKISYRISRGIQDKLHATDAISRLSKNRSGTFQQVKDLKDVIAAMAKVQETTSAEIVSKLIYYQNIKDALQTSSQREEALGIMREKLGPDKLRTFRGTLSSALGGFANEDAFLIELIARYYTFRFSNEDAVLFRKGKLPGVGQAIIAATSAIHLETTNVPQAKNFHQVLVKGFGRGLPKLTTGQKRKALQRSQDLVKSILAVDAETIKMQHARKKTEKRLKLTILGVFMLLLSLVAAVPASNSADIPMSSQTVKATGINLKTSEMTSVQLNAAVGDYRVPTTQALAEESKWSLEPGEQLNQRRFDAYPKLRRWLIIPLTGFMILSMLGLKFVNPKNKSITAVQMRQFNHSEKIRELVLRHHFDTRLGIPPGANRKDYFDNLSKQFKFDAYPEKNLTGWFKTILSLCFGYYQQSINDEGQKTLLIPAIIIRLLMNYYSQTEINYVTKRAGALAEFWLKRMVEFQTGRFSEHVKEGVADPRDGWKAEDEPLLNMQEETVVTVNLNQKNTISTVLQNQEITVGPQSVPMIVLMFVQSILNHQQISTIDYKVLNEKLSWDTADQQGAVEQLKNGVAPENILADHPHWLSKIGIPTLLDVASRVEGSLAQTFIKEFRAVRDPDIRYAGERGGAELLIRGRQSFERNNEFIVQKSLVKKMTTLAAPDTAKHLLSVLETINADEVTLDQDKKKALAILRNVLKTMSLMPCGTPVSFDSETSRWLASLLGSCYRQTNKTDPSLAVDFMRLGKDDRRGEEVTVFAAVSSSVETIEINAHNMKIEMPLIAEVANEKDGMVRSKTGSKELRGTLFNKEDVSLVLERKQEQVMMLSTQIAIMKQLTQWLENKPLRLKTAGHIWLQHLMPKAYLNYIQQTIDQETTVFKADQVQSLYKFMFTPGTVLQQLYMELAATNPRSRRAYYKAQRKMLNYMMRYLDVYSEISQEQETQLSQEESQKLLLLNLNFIHQFITKNDSIIDTGDVKSSIPLALYESEQDLPQGAPARVDCAILYFGAGNNAKMARLISLLKKNDYSIKHQIMKKFDRSKRRISMATSA